MRLFTGALLIAVSAAIAVAAPVEVVLQNGLDGYNGTQDTYLFSGNSTNYGTSSSCYITPGPDRRALLKFDLSHLPEGAKASSGASVTILSRTSSDATPTITVSMHMMTGASANWSQTACSWEYLNNADQTPWVGGAGLTAGVDYETNAISSVTAAFGKGWARTFQFSQEDMQRAIDAGFLSVVFMTDYSDMSMYFRSTEYGTAEQRPKLTFSYDVIPEPATLGSVLIGSVAVLFRRVRRTSKAKA
ncbi:MAG: PEP-CTERM sorting domain-containing protein [Planctomycetes bacterium]|jgi:hypothetical protein|nr:PEP-CTERM sorting domain-containing protein [Planctomycetota bacterium]